MHDREPLRDDASLRDFNGGIGCHVALAVEEALLLPQDMTWPNCEAWGRMKSFSTVKYIWGWYNVNLFFFTYTYYL